MTCRRMGLACCTSRASEDAFIEETFGSDRGEMPESSKLPSSTSVKRGTHRATRERSEMESSRKGRAPARRSNV